MCKSNFCNTAQVSTNFPRLDHVYHDAALRLGRLWLHKSLGALVASGHLPLAADFTLA